MIKFAKKHCNMLVVIPCCSTKEHISAQVRSKWLREELCEVPDVTIQEYTYDETLLPNVSESDRSVSKVWSDVFLRIAPATNILVTSEPYGEFVAEYMGIQHILFDAKRLCFPIASSTVREHMLLNWKFLPNAVKRHYQKRVVVSGTESTGKSTLCCQLCKHFGGILVKETAREVIPDSNQLALQDLYTVAKCHAQAVKAALVLGQCCGCSTEEEVVPVVVIDTDVYTTQSYARLFFNDTLALSDHIYDMSSADIRVYLCSSGVPFVQDGTRVDSHQLRLDLDTSHRQTMHDFGISYVELSLSASREPGADSYDWDGRFDQAVSLISQLFCCR